MSAPETPRPPADDAADDFVRRAAEAATDAALKAAERRAFAVVAALLAKHKLMGAEDRVTVALALSTSAALVAKRANMPAQHFMAAAATRAAAVYDGDIDIEIVHE